MESNSRKWNTDFLRVLRPKLKDLPRDDLHHTQFKGAIVIYHNRSECQIKIIIYSKAESHGATSAHLNLLNMSFCGKRTT